MSLTRSSFDAAAFCALPLVRRAYQALVVGLAVFLLTLVGLHEPFRGYLAEVHLAGPATEGLDLEEAAGWLKRADPQVAAVAIPAGEISPKSQIRVTFVARLPAPATKHLEGLTSRWLYQYLPDRLQAYRRAALAELRTAAQTAREREDAARAQLEALRQRQFAALPHAAAEAVARSISAEADAAASAAAVSPAALADDRAKSHEKLEALRLELSRLIANFTDAHPQVITLRSQIAALERQLGLSAVEALPPPSRPELIPPTASEPQSRIQRALRLARPAGHFVSTGGATALRERQNASDLALSAEINAAVRDLAGASRDWQLAEHRLNERMHELSSRPTAAQWQAGPAEVVARLGGTPRSSTLVVGGLLAAVAGTIMFRASRAAGRAKKIESSKELATALELPVVANTRTPTAGSRFRRLLVTPMFVQVVLFFAEAVVVVAVAACLVAIAIEPSLVRQVLADPFGTLSEVMERFAF